MRAVLPTVAVCFTVVVVPSVIYPSALDPTREVGCHITVCLAAAPLSAQQSTEPSGERVYALVSEAVFLIQVADAEGQPAATATGFLVGADLILTNAHVARAGTMSLHVGSLEVPCRLERIDALNDLALCRMPGKSGATPLRLATQEPKPGATIYAVGNPKGLERTISQGLFTGYRELDGHQVAQISAAISPGSSGGPVLNATGELVGVAVFFLTGGQNLNFAVPVSVVRSFLTNESVAFSTAALLDAARRLKKDETTIEFSNAPDSEWQKTESQIRELLLRTVDGTSDKAVLEDVYEIAEFWRTDVRVAAARKLLTVVKPPGRDVYTKLARALYYSTDESAGAEIEEAERVATRSVELGRGIHAEDLVLLGQIQRQARRSVQAYATFQKASLVAESGTPEAVAAFFALFQIAVELERTSDADSWFRRAKGEGVTALQIASFADYLGRQSRHAEAAAAYMEAFNGAPTVYSYTCSAGVEYWATAGNDDEALAAERQCIELAASKKGTEGLIAHAHRTIADILNRRNVFDGAASHAKEAIQIHPSNPWAHHYLAQALNGQRRFTEAAASAKNALTLSDGQYPTMHFSLGSALFELHQYAEARQAFQKAAELEPKDSAAAFNVALCLEHLNFFNDALHWYREVLRRDPSAPYKEEVLKKIDTLSRL